MNLPPIVLASASPRRSQLLREMQLEFKVVPSDAAEVSHQHLSPVELAQFNARLKAQTVAIRFPNALVMGVDTVVAWGTRVFGKPVDMEDAFRMIQILQGQTHQVVSGVCLIHLQGARERLFADQTEVTFRKLSPEQIRAYHQQANPLDKAGAYGIQEKGELLVDSISGSFANVMGLPVERLRTELNFFSF